MANTYKVLGQAVSVSNTDVNVYVVPANTSAVVSTFSICNNAATGTASRFNIAVVPSGETLGNKHYIMRHQLLDIADTVFKTIGLTLAAGDTVVLNSDTADLSMSLFGNAIG